MNFFECIKTVGTPSRIENIEEGDFEVTNGTEATIPVHIEFDLIYAWYTGEGGTTTSNIYYHFGTSAGTTNRNGCEITFSGTSVNYRIPATVVGSPGNVRYGVPGTWHYIAIKFTEEE